MENTSDLERENNGNKLLKYLLINKLITKSSTAYIMFPIKIPLYNQVNKS